MNTGGLNVLHDTHHVDFVAVADGVNLSFLSPVEEVVDQHDHVGVFLKDAQHVALQFLVIDHNPHVLATQYVAGAD